jgi:hypothetical protein
MKRAFFPSLGVCVFCAAHAAGQISYTDQWRDIEAGAANGVTYEWIWATDFEPFSAAVDMYNSSPDGSFASGRAMTQNSRLDPDRITFTGATSAGYGEVTAGHSWAAYGRSQVNASFSLAEPSNFEANIRTTSLGSTTFDIFLMRTGGATIFSGQGFFSGMLQPGDYTFRAFIRADGFPYIDPDSGYEIWYGSHATIDAWLVIPTPGTAMLALVGVALSLRRRR